MNFSKKFTCSIPKKKLPDDFLSREAGQVKPEKSRPIQYLIFLVLLIPAGNEVPISVKAQPLLEKIKQRGELRFATRYGPGIYYKTAHGIAGLEHDLARLFAKRLGIDVRFFASDGAFRLDRMIASGKADLAGGMFADTRHDFPLRFGPTYRQVAEQLLYGEGHEPPLDLYEVGRKGILQVPADSEQAETLKSLGREINGLNWRISYEHGADELSALASQGRIDYTVTDSDRSLFLRYFYPDLQVAFDIGKNRPLAWAVSMDEDHSLYDEVQHFFTEIRANHQLEQLTDRYFGHTERLDNQENNALRKDFRTRLPHFKHWFIQAGRRYELDWRLLAAVAYQESRWDREAVSPEGVKGLMMLTEDTARELNVQNRTDPASSIMGAAAYLKQTLSNIPEEIPDPDRTWYALAAYNLGYTHIEEARKWVQHKGGDPAMWIELKKALPRLNTLPRPGASKHSRRGRITVNYVTNIRRYYDLLVWLTETDKQTTYSSLHKLL